MIIQQMYGLPNVAKRTSTQPYPVVFLLVSLGLLVSSVTSAAPARCPELCIEYQERVANAPEQLLECDSHPKVTLTVGQAGYTQMESDILRQDENGPVKYYFVGAIPTEQQGSCQIFEEGEFTDSVYITLPQAQACLRSVNNICRSLGY